MDIRELVSPLTAFPFPDEVDVSRDIHTRESSSPPKPTLDSNELACEYGGKLIVLFMSESTLASGPMCEKSQGVGGPLHLMKL